MLSVARRIWHRLARGLLWVGILGAVATPHLVPAVRAGAVGTRRHGLDRLNAKLVPAFSYSDRYRPTCRFLPGQDSPSLLLGLVGGVFPDRPRQETCACMVWVSDARTRTNQRLQRLWKR
jgi:hypothetical protein